MFPLLTFGIILSQEATPYEIPREGIPGLYVPTAVSHCQCSDTELMLMSS